MGILFESAVMAKTIIIDITWLRPLKLIGILNLLCGLLCFIISLALEDWVVSDENESSQFYMGLWNQCSKRDLIKYNSTEAEAQRDTNYGWICKPAAIYAKYMSVVQALMVVAFLASCIAMVIAFLAYFKREWRFFYKISAWILIVAAVLVMVAVIFLPIKFVIKLPFSAFFWFGWGYGLAWSAMCFILCAAVLFLCSSDTKEIYHKQKRVSI